MGVTGIERAHTVGLGIASSILTSSRLLPVPYLPSSLLNFSSNASKASLQRNNQTAARFSVLPIFCVQGERKNLLQLITLIHPEILLVATGCFQHE